MNLVQQAEQIKLIPDAALGLMQQNPTTFPPYLVMAEMQRREAMRKASRGSADPVQQKTVAEEMRERFNPAPQMQQMPQNPQQQMAQPVPQPGMPSMRMAGGGLASLLEQDQGGGLAGLYGSLTGLGGMPPINPSMANPQFPGAPPMGTYADEPATTQEQLMKRFPTRDLKSVKSEVDALRGPSGLKNIADLLAIQEKDARGKKPKIGEILMNLGLAMASSKRPDFAGAVGEGGLAALNNYKQQREMNTGRADAIMKQRAGLAEAMQRRDDQGLEAAMGVHAQEQHNRNADMQSLEASKRAQWNQGEETKRNERMQTRMENIQGMRDKTATERDDARFTADSQERRLDRESRERMSQAEIKARIAAANLQMGNRPEKLSPILQYVDRATDNIQNAIRGQQAVLNAAVSDEERAAAKKSLEGLVKQYDNISKVQAKELVAQYPGHGFEALIEPVIPELTLEDARAKYKPRGDVPKAPSTRDAAVKGLKSLIPGLPDLSQLGGALSKLKSVNPMTGRPWVAEN